MAINKNFVVKNGFEASTDLIAADAVTRRVGVGTTVATYTLHVNGGIGATTLFVSGISTLGVTSTTDLTSQQLKISGISTLGVTTATNLTLQQLNVSGVSTFSNIFLNGYVSAGNTFGQANQVLVSTGVGVTWKDTGSLRTTTTFTATAAQTTFSVVYNLTTSLDVFINGVKLTSTEFTATSGTTVVLDDPCFGGEVVEIITYDIDFPLNFTGVTIKEEGSLVANNVNTLNFVGLAITAIATSGSASTISIDAQPPLNSGSQVTVGIITATSAIVGSGATINSTGINVTGIVTATNGFVSTANTTPIQIQLVGNLLTFQAVGIGSTSFTLF